MTQIIGAPSFFPTVWGWIKRWFDPVTVSKIFILSASEVKPTLTKFFDPDSIPRLYGGNLDWEFGQTPNLDDDTRQLLGGFPDEWVRGPMIWDGTKATALGSVKGKARHEVVAVAPEGFEPHVLKSVGGVSANGHAAKPNGVVPTSADIPPPAYIQAPEQDKDAHEEEELAPASVTADSASAREPLKEEEKGLNATAESPALPKVEDAQATATATAPTTAELALSSAPTTNGSADKSNPPTTPEISIPELEKHQNGELPSPTEPAFMTPLESPGDPKAVVASGILK